MSSPESSRRRRQHLINGRRVQLIDLINADLLHAGEELVFARPRLGQSHRATVTERGRIRIADGQEYASPSGASDAVANVATDGWYSWQVGDDGPYLWRLRRDLLESVAEMAEKDAALRRYTELNDARTKAEAGTPWKLTVRDLIERWGVHDRDREVIAQIQADLANHGLATVPDFTAVGLESTVIVTIPPSADGEGTTDEGHDAFRMHALPQTAASVAEEDAGEIGLTLGNVLPNDHQLISVAPSASLDDAITVMLLRDFSQIPILSGERDLRGVVTYRSITRARQSGTDVSLSDAIIPARDYLYNTRLLDVVDVLLQDEFVFVRGHDKRIYGIVTAADVVRIYSNTATPFLLIGELDQELRKLIRNEFTIEEVQRVSVEGTNLTSFDHMTMGDYLAVIRKPEFWEKLGWNLNRKIVGAHLEEITHIRNKIMHFNPDPISQLDIERVRIFLQVLRDFTK